MKIIGKIAIFICITGLFGCSDFRLSKNIKGLYADSIKMPQNMEVIYKGQIANLKPNILAAKIKLVIYYSASGCTSCKVSHLYDLEELFELDSTGQFSPIIIFSPDSITYNNLISILKIYPNKYQIFIDKEQLFNRINKVIPNDTRYHTFLLDKNNRVVLVGNPLASDKMWTLFKSTLDNMLSHDGVYVLEK